MKIILVGAGGHAKAVAEAISASGHVLVAYVDPRPCAWLKDTRRFSGDASCNDDTAEGVVLGLGAVTPDGLTHRFSLFERYRARGWDAPAVRHPTAIVSESASMQPGGMILAGAVVQPGANIGEAAIVNTAAVVEHDSRVGRGAHIAPGAIVLGGATVGDAAMIGAGAVVLPGATVPRGASVSALRRYSA